MISFLQISDIHFTDEMGNDDGCKLMKCIFLEDIEVYKDGKYRFLRGAIGK